MKKLYTAKATAIAGRDGHAQTDDGNLSVKLSRPGSGEKGSTNPEQLFACGYGACFGGAISAVAKKSNLTLGEVKVEPQVSLNEDDNGGYFLDVALNVTLDGIDKEVAKDLVKKAHAVCPYSKATRNNIEVKITVNGESIN